MLTLAVFVFDTNGRSLLVMLFSQLYALYLRVTAALFLLRKGLPIALFLPRAQVEVVPHLALIPMLRNPLHLPVIVT